MAFSHVDEPQMTHSNKSQKAHHPFKYICTWTRLDQSPKPLHQSLRLERASDHLLQTSHKRQLQIVVKYEEPTSRMPINCQCNDPSPSNGAQMLTQSKNHSFKNLHCYDFCLLCLMIQVILLKGLCPEISDKIDSMNHRMNKHWKKTENFVHGIREHGNHLLPVLSSIFICSVWLVGISQNHEDPTWGQTHSYKIMVSFQQPY